MSSQLVTESREDRPSSGGWQPASETAPSETRESEPTFIRWVGTLGLAAAILASLLLVLNGIGRGAWLLQLIGSGGAIFMLVLGLAAMLCHAVSERDQQLRRLYAVMGALWLVSGVVLAIVPAGGAWGSLFLPGFVCLALGLLFEMAAIRNESEQPVRDLLVSAVGGVGGLMALVAIVGSFIRGAFLLPYGFLIALLGLAYVTAFVNMRGVSDDRGYRAGMGLGALGGVAVVVALILSFVYIGYVIPTGMLLMALGLLYMAVSAMLCSDNTFVVLTRRELAAFFYSPIAYFVLIGLTLVAWFYYLLFVGELVPTAFGDGGVLEPVVQNYVSGSGPIICAIAIVPFLTMRLLSEERRAGTLEVLMTAPVNEVTVVLSKFTAVLVFFMVAWLPWAMFLVDLRIEGGKEFDYRPLLSFFIAMTCMGGGFLAMGLFFSSLVNNQIAAAVMTFAGMLVLTGLSLMEWQVNRGAPGGLLVTTLNHVSFLRLWWTSLEGALTPRYLLFHISAAVFWLFLTVKVLEARKWS